MSLAEKVRHGEPIPAPLAALLSAATPITRAGMWLRKRQTPVRFDAHVISIGNLTAGGTGKTPAVIARAREELASGAKVAVLTRGYGTPQDAPVVSSKDVSPRDYVSKLGDEPALMLRKLPELIVLKGKDRLRSIRTALEVHECDTIILDDGYQYVRLARDEDVLLVDTANPFGNGHLIPRGVLREPLESMNRASEIVLTRCDQAKNLEDILETIKRHVPGAPIRFTCHQPTGFVRLADGARLPTEFVADEKAIAISAIGNPAAFHRTLESLGAHIESTHTFPDHAPIPARALRNAGIAIVTEKDGVKLQDPPDNVYALSVELRTWESPE